MKKFNYLDYDIHTEVQIGNDDIIYGNYVDWNDFREGHIDELIRGLEIEIPWGKQITKTEFNEFLSLEYIKYGITISEYKLNKLCFNEKKLIHFPKKEELDYNKFINEIFDYLGVPSGIDYEAELPDDLKYWSQDNYQYEEDYHLYKLSSRSYEQIINDLQSGFQKEYDPLIRKSIILAAMVSAETLLRSTVVKSLPNDKDLNNIIKKIYNKEILNRLKSTYKLKKLYKDIYRNNAPKMPWLSLRNSLAHNIEGPEIVDDVIYYEEKTHKYLLDELFADLLDFGLNISLDTNQNLF